MAAASLTLMTSEVYTLLNNIQMSDQERRLKMKYSVSSWKLSKLIMLLMEVRRTEA
jgi:hypothetical protein